MQSYLYYVVDCEGTKYCRNMEEGEELLCLKDSGKATMKSNIWARSWRTEVLLTARIWEDKNSRQKENNN